MKNKSNVIRNIFFALGVLVIFIMVYSLGFDVIYENLKNTGCGSLQLLEYGF